MQKLMEFDQVHQKTEHVLSAFKSGRRVTLGSMKGSHFGLLMLEIKRLRQRQEMP